MKKKREIFWGVFFICGAIFMLVTQMGITPGVGVWGLLFSILWVALLIKGITKKNYFEIFFSLAFLAIVWDEQLGIQAITPWPVVGAAALLSIGFYMLFPQKPVITIERNGKKVNAEDLEFEVYETVEGEDGDHINVDVNFHSTIKYVNSNNFKSANLENAFGDLKVYFDNAQMAGDSARISLENSFGSTELYFPKNWKVSSDISSSFGGIRVKGKNDPDGMHTVYLHGDNSFGATTIYFI